MALVSPFGFLSAGAAAAGLAVAGFSSSVGINYFLHAILPEKICCCFSLNVSAPMMSLANLLTLERIFADMNGSFMTATANDCLPIK
jgi:hypothetical protein